MTHHFRYHNTHCFFIGNQKKEALIGDLPPLGQVMPDDLASIGSWDAIRKSGAVKIFPGHAGFLWDIAGGSDT
jgi:hypothetical protein